MQIGLLVESEEGLDWQRWRRVCRQAEDLGFASIWVSDHLESPWVADRYGLDAWLALSVAAAETTRLRLGPLVSPITFRPPAIVARMADALRDLSQGRLVLGLGLGWNADEHQRWGIAFPDAIERARRLAEGIDRIRSMLAEPVPILLGGSGRRLTLPLVARLADEWNVTTASPAHYAETARELDELCVDLGRDPTALRRSVACGVLVGVDEADLCARARRLGERVPPFAERLRGGAAVRTAAAEQGWLVGLPTEIRAQIDAFAACGVEEVMLGVYDPDDLTALDLIAAEIVGETQ